MKTREVVLAALLGLMLAGALIQAFPANPSRMNVVAAWSCGLSFMLILTTLIDWG